MTDQEYVRELSRLADAYEAGQISRDEWKKQVAELGSAGLKAGRKRIINFRAKLIKIFPGIVCLPAARVGKALPLALLTLHQNI